MRFVDMKSIILSKLQWVLRLSFGDFEKEELKKFLRMGLIFTLIVGVYWTLRSLKDSVFIQLVDKLYLPYAKTFSIIVLLPLVGLYTKLLERFSRNKMLILMPAFYGIMMLAFSFCLLLAQAPQQVIIARAIPLYIATKVLGFVFYAFVESWGSLMLAALFWAFATDTTDPISAKKGFPLVYALGQCGGILFPYVIGSLPHRLGLSTDALSLFILGCLVLFIIPCIKLFFYATPKDLLKSYHEAKITKEESSSETGFLEGLKLMIQHKYLLGIFTVISIFEIVVTIFDFNFKVAAGTEYSGVALSRYLSLYGSTVNTVSLLCLLFGISNITRFLGVGVSLAAMPLIVGCALFGFLTVDNLSFLFIIMVGAKAINYALNGPTLKQLYIPTTPNVRFKAQAWIETFGSRASKEAGSLFNMILAPLQGSFGPALGRSYYLFLSGCLGFPLLAVWFMTACFLGRAFWKAINEKSVVC